MIRTVAIYIAYLMLTCFESSSDLYIENKMLFGKLSRNLKPFSIFAYENHKGKVSQNHIA